MSLKGKRVLVTGSNGFIGSNLVRRLLKEGADIYCIDKIKLNQDGIKGNTLDIRDLENLKEIIKEINPNIIFHLVALINRSRDINLIKEIHEINLNGTINMLLATKDINYDLFVYPNTSEVYGNQNKPPFKENMKVEAMSPYSASKLCGEIYCKLFSDLLNKPIVMFRMPIAYGPGQKVDMFIPELMKAIKEKKEFIMTKGEQTRDFIYIDDIIEAFILCCYKKGIRGLFNLGSGKETQLKEVLELLQKQIKVNVKFDKPYRKNEIWHYYLDISKIKNELNWEPRVRLDKGLKRTLEWWESNG